MENVDTVTRIALFHIFIEQVVGSAFLDPFRGDGEQSLFFVDHNQVIIFPYNAEQGIVKLHLASAIIDTHYIPRFQLRVELAGDPFVDRNLSVT